MNKHRITIHQTRTTNKESIAYLLDKTERDMLALSDHLYYHDPKSKGKEESFNLIGIVHQNTNSEVRIITGLGHGKVINSSATVRNPAETIEAIDDEAKAKQLSIVGVAHLHPFPNGHKFLSGTDKETMKTYGTIDPGHLFIVINPLSSDYTVYRWNTEKNEPLIIKPVLINTAPLMVSERKMQSHDLVNTESMSSLIQKIQSLTKDALMLFASSTSIAFITFFTLASFNTTRFTQGVIGIFAFLSLLMFSLIWRFVNDEFQYAG
jgi:hypothetical protein